MALTVEFFVLFQDVLIAKSSRLEVRQLTQAVIDEDGAATTTPAMPSASDTFPVVLQLPINGRLIALHPIRVPGLSTSAVFILQERNHYAVISYDPLGTNSTNSLSPPPQAGPSSNDNNNNQRLNPYPVQTHASGRLDEQSDGKRPVDDGPTLVAMGNGCIVLHAFDGLLTIIPVDPN